MLRDITIGQYYPGDSIIHRLDPRVKLFFVLIFMISLFVINRFTPYIGIALVIFLLIRITRIPLSYLFKGLKPLFFILIFTFVINLFATPGETVFRIWKLTISQEGIRIAIMMFLRLVFLVIGTSLLTLTTSPIQLTDGIEKALRPFSCMGVPAHEIAMMMTIALRFIPTLLDETDKIMKAQQARGADFESGNLIKRAQNMIPLLVPLFISAFRRADELAMAMESRCYRGGEGRTRLKEIKYQRNDYLAYGSTVAYLAIIIAFRWVNVP